MKLTAEPVDMIVIQVYTPTSDHVDEDVERLYEELEELIEKEKGSDHLIILGDWNAVVGEVRNK